MNTCRWYTSLISESFKTSERTFDLRYVLFIFDFRRESYNGFLLLSFTERGLGSSPFTHTSESRTDNPVSEESREPSILPVSFGLAWVGDEEGLSQRDEKQEVTMTPILSKIEAENRETKEDRVMT